MQAFFGFLCNYFLFYYIFMHLYIILCIKYALCTYFPIFYTFGFLNIIAYFLILSHKKYSLCIFYANKLYFSIFLLSYHCLYSKVKKHYCTKYNSIVTKCFKVMFLNILHKKLNCKYGNSK